LRAGHELRRLKSKEKSRGSTEPRLALTNEKRKRSCYYFFFLAAGFFLAAVFFAAFFLAAIIHYLLRSFFYDPVNPIAVIHRGSPQSLNDEVSVTLAVVRNGSRTRVVVVASVVATTSRIAIQVVLIPEWNAYVKGLIRFFS
jgi:hypothetical protein